MAFDYDKALQRIIAKATILEERYQRLAQSHSEATAKISELQQQIISKDKELEQLKQQVEYLQLATTIAPTRQQVESARSLITGLMRDIDRCITDLSD